MSAGDWIGLGAIVIFAVFVGILAVPVFKLGRLFDELRCSVKGLTGEVTPTLNELTRTVVQVNQQIGKADTITTHVADASANVSAFTSLAAATLGKPLIKISAFSFAVRQVLKKQRKSPDETPTGDCAAPAPDEGAPTSNAYTLRDRDPLFFESPGQAPRSAQENVHRSANLSLDGRSTVREIEAVPDSDPTGAEDPTDMDREQKDNG